MPGVDRSHARVLFEFQSINFCFSLKFETLPFQWHLRDYIIILQLASNSIIKYMIASLNSEKIFVSVKTIAESLKSSRCLVCCISSFLCITFNFSPHEKLGYKSRPSVKKKNKSLDFLFSSCSTIY